MIHMELDYGHDPAQAPVFVLVDQRIMHRRIWADKLVRVLGTVSKSVASPVR